MAEIEQVCPTHRWRCMNCNEMASSYICGFCGKPSYQKEETKEPKETAALEKTLKKPTEKKTQAAGKNEVEIQLEKKLQTAALTVSTELKSGVKQLKKSISCLLGVAVVAAVVVITLCTNMQNKINSYEAANNELITKVQAQSLEIEKLQKAANEKPEPEYIAYTVKAGETLEQICQQNNIDFLANKNIILAINGIQNSNVIRVGQTVILPKLNSTKN